MPGVVLTLSLAVVAPMLRPGHPLRYDLVSVPDQVLGADALGLGDRLPRAVPLDAATWLWGALSPWPSWPTVAMLLGLVAAGLGCARLTPGPWPAGCAAAAWAIWNPWVLERLAIGHVPLVLAYGALPWIVRSAYRWSTGTGRLATLWLWCAAAALTPSGWVLAAGAMAAGTLAAERSTVRGRRAAAALGGLLVLGSPWMVAAAVHPAGPSGSSGGGTALAAFAVRDSVAGPSWWTALGLGGLWNDAALPASRESVLVLLGIVVLLALALPGAWAAAHSVPRRWVVVAASVAVGSYLVAVLPAVAPVQPAAAWLLDAVPGAGLLREGHRWLAPFAVLAAVCAGAGASWWGTRLLPGRGLQGFAVAVVGVTAAVCLVPDLGWGVGGRLTPRTYPDDWGAVRRELDARPDTGAVLVLPWQPFRVYGWADEVPVLDPAPRALPGRVLVSDALPVGSDVLPPEGEASTAVGLQIMDGELDRGELADSGVGWVLVQRGTPGLLPELPPAEVVVAGDDLLLHRLPGSPGDPGGPSARDWSLVVAAHAGAAAVAFGSAVAIVTGPLRRRRQHQR